jgi:SAM-dependent methyltransferase
MPPDQYVIRGGIPGRVRLRLLGRVLRPTTVALLNRVGLRSGMNCLDVGCGGGDATLEIARIVGPTGRVVGWDIDEIKLELARNEARTAELTNVEFQRVDIRQTEVQTKFEFAYSRFLLTHLPDVPDIIETMRLMLRPGGTLVLEDIDFRGHFCHPESPVVDRYVELYSQAVAQRGGDPNIGPRLPRLLLDAGFVDVDLHVIQPAALEGDIKMLNPVTLESIAEAVISGGLASANEVQQIAEELFDLARNPRVVVSMPRIIQTWGRRSAESERTPGSRRVS